VYHVMSRTACGQFLFGDDEKRVFLSMLRKQAGFCGVEVLAYCVMGNHFHLLVAVPETIEISDAELLRRYRILYDDARCPASSASPVVLKQLLAANEKEGQLLRERLMARMHNLCVFMRELKQRFGIWYNHHHQNQGTIWAKRFTSVVVESSREALMTVAAYIDLNPVRAGLVDDPENYPFSSYGVAMRGQAGARCGYAGVFCEAGKWEELLPAYRVLLYGKGSRSKGSIDKDLGVITANRAEQVLAAGGRLALSDVLRMRVRYFSAGAAVGSDAFLSVLGSEWKGCYGLRRKRDSHPMRSAEWGQLRAFRNLQVSPVDLKSLN
jgi:REP element-mobilizing transposase RayT